MPDRERGTYYADSTVRSYSGLMDSEKKDRGMSCLECGAPVAGEAAIWSSRHGEGSRERSGDSHGF